MSRGVGVVWHCNFNENQVVSFWLLTSTDDFGFVKRTIKIKLNYIRFTLVNQIIVLLQKSPGYILMMVKPWLIGSYCKKEYILYSVPKWTNLRGIDITISYHVMLFYIILYYFILYYIILYYISYIIILYYIMYIIIILW